MSEPPPNEEMAYYQLHVQGHMASHTDANGRVWESTTKLPCTYCGTLATLGWCLLGDCECEEFEELGTGCAAMAHVFASLCDVWGSGRHHDVVSLKYSAQRDQGGQGSQRDQGGQGGQRDQGGQGGQRDQGGQGGHVRNRVDACEGGYSFVQIGRAHV